MNYLTGVRLRELPDEWSYLRSLPLIRHLHRCDRLDFSRPVTFFSGENGTGKSTLLEAIAVSLGFNAEGGSRDFSFSSRDTHSELGRLLTTIKTVTPKDGFFLRSESFYNVASFLDETSTLDRYGGRSFHEQSHGESFLELVRNRFEGHGIYLLDEPEAALSPQRLMSLIVLIDDLVVNSDSQFIIATHSPILMAYPKAEILEFSESGITSVDYRDTENYRLTKMILDDPDRMMHYLLDGQ